MAPLTTRTVPEAPCPACDGPTYRKGGEGPSAAKGRALMQDAASDPVSGADSEKATKQKAKVKNKK